MPETAISPYDDIVRQAQDEVSPPQPAGRRGPPVLPQTQPGDVAPPALSKQAARIRTAPKPPTVPQILQPAAQAVQGLTDGGPDYSQAIKQAQQEQKEEDFTKHYLHKLPQFQAYAHPVHPEEEAFHASETALQQATRQLGSNLPIPGTSVAAVRPEYLQHQNSQDLITLHKMLPVLDKEFMAQGNDLKKRGAALAASIDLYNKGKLSPTALDQLNRDIAIQTAAQKAQKTRAEQLYDYDNRFKALYNTYKDQQFFPSVYELGGRAKDTPGGLFVKRISKYIPIPGISGQVAAEPQVNRARNIAMLTGQYPQPPPNPGKTPQERELYNKQQRDLVDWLESAPAPELRKREFDRLTPYQKQIWPTVYKMWQEEQKLNEPAVRAALIDYGAQIVSMAAGGFVGGKVSGALAGDLAPYLVDDPLTALLTRGAGAGAKQFALRGIPTLAGGTVAGTVAGTATAGIETPLLGGSREETIRNMQQGGKTGAIWGTAGAFLAHLGVTAHSALLNSFDPVHTPPFVENTVNDWQAKGLVTEREAPLVKERLIGFARTPRIMKEAAAEKLARDFQFIGDRAKAQHAAAARPATAERINALPAAPTEPRLPVTIEGTHAPISSPLEAPLTGMDWRQVPPAVERPSSSPYPRQNALPPAPGTHLAGGQGQVVTGAPRGPVGPMAETQKPGFVPGPTSRWPTPLVPAPSYPRPVAAPTREGFAPPTAPAALPPGPEGPRALPPSGTVGTPLPGQGGVLLRGPHAQEPIPPSAPPLPPPSGQQPIPYVAAEQKGAGTRIRGPRGQEPPAPPPSPLEPPPAPQTPPPAPPPSVERRLTDLRQMQADMPPQSKAHQAVTAEIADLERMGAKVAPTTTPKTEAPLPTTAEALQAEIARLREERSQFTINTPEFGRLTSRIGRAQDRLAVLQNPPAPAPAPESPTTRALAVQPEIKKEVPEAVGVLEEAAHKAMLEAGVPEDRIKYDKRAGKYVVTGKVSKELQQRLNKAGEIFRNKTFEIQTPEGTTHYFKGLDISHGTETGRDVPAQPGGAQPAQGRADAGLPAQSRGKPQLAAPRPEQPAPVVAPSTQAGGKTGGGATGGNRPLGGGTATNPPEVREPAAGGAASTGYQPGTVLKKSATGLILRLDERLPDGRWKATVIEPGSLNVKKGHVFSPVGEDTLKDFKPVKQTPESGKKGGESGGQPQFLRDLLQDETGAVDPKAISDKLKQIRDRLTSAPAEDTEQTGGILYAPKHPDDPRWQAVDQDQAATWKVARKVDNETVLQKLQRAWDTWHYPNPELKGLPQFEEFSQRLIEAQKRGIADMATMRAYYSYMKGIESEAAHQTLSQLIFWRDLKRSAAKGLPLPKPYEPDMIEPGLLDTEVAAMRDPKVMEAFHKRTEILTPVVTRRMELMKKIANFDLKLDPNDYMHRMILAYANEQRNLRGSIQHPVGVRGHEKARKGSELPYEKAISETDMDWLPQMMYDNHVLGLYEYLYDHQNKYGELKKAADETGTTWDKLLKLDPKYKDYDIIRTTSQNPLHRAFTLPARIAAMIQQNGTELVSDQDITEKTVLGSPAKPLIVRKEIARAIEKLSVPDNALDAELRGAAAELRRFMMLNPLHIAKFAAKKLGTDIETLVRNPATLPHYRRAIQDVIDFRRTKEWTPELEQYFDLGGFQGILQSGYGIRSKGIELLPRFLQQLPPENANPDVLGDAAKKAGAVWTKYADRAGLEVTMLDSTTRYAAWLYARDYGMKHGGMMPGWGSSPPERLMALGQREEGIDQEGINRRAWRWAQDMIGNYDERSAGNRWLSRRAKILFPAWPEVNARRYYRGTQNVFTSTQATDLGIATQKFLNDHGLGGSPGGRAVGAATTWVAQLGYFAAGLLALRAATQAYNELTPGVRDKEAGIDPVLRDQPHITLPFNNPVTGNPMVVMLPGGLGELFDHAPVDTNGLMHDYLHGLYTGNPMTFADVHKRLSEPWYERISRSFGGPRQLIEVTHTRDVRSGAEQILTRAGLRDLYRLASNIPAFGIPKERGRLARTLGGAVGTYESDPGDNAYFNARRDVGYFLNQRGVALNEPVSRGTQRSNAFYWLQRSLRAGDRESALRYTADYAIASNWTGKRNPVDDMRASMIKLDPITDLKPLERQEYIKHLDEDTKKQWIMAYEDYRRMVAPEVKLPPVGKDFDQWIRDAQGRIYTGISRNAPIQTLTQIAQVYGAVHGASTPAEQAIQLRNLTPQQQQIQQRMNDYTTAHPARR